MQRNNKKFLSHRDLDAGPASPWLEFPTKTLIPGHAVTYQSPWAKCVSLATHPSRSAELSLELDSLSALTTLQPTTIFIANFAAILTSGSSLLKTNPNCVFCQIVAGNSPARVPLPGQRHYRNRQPAGLGAADALGDAKGALFADWHVGQRPAAKARQAGRRHGGNVRAKTASGFSPISDAMACRARAMATCMWSGARSLATTSSTT